MVIRGHAGYQKAVKVHENLVTKEQDGDSQCYNEQWLRYLSLFLCQQLEKKIAVRECNKKSRNYRWRQPHNAKHP